MERVVSLLFLLVSTGLAQQSNLLETVFQWQQMDYEFPSASARENMIRHNTFIPENVVPIDVDAWQQKEGQGKIFVTVPKFRPGIPSTLNTVVTNNKGEPLLRPYPDWSWHREGHCDGITSVFRVQIDQCGRLWVLDTGATDIFGGIKHTCPPKLLVFNLKNNKLITRYSFSNTDIKDYSLLVTLVVDVLDPKNGCQNAFAYVADVTGFGIIVVDINRSRSWRITSNLMYPYPLSGHFDLNGVQFELMDGVLGLALSPPHNSYQDKTLFFHSLASVRESWVSTDLLRNSSLFEDGVNHVPEEFHVSKSERPGQVAPEATDSAGTLFFSILTSNTLNCWNPSRAYEASNLVELVRDTERLQFVSGIKVVKDQQNKEWVWLLSDRFQNVMVGSVPQDEVNYRILRFPVEEMIRGTSCVRRQSAPYQTQAGGPSYSQSVFS